jgi:transcriptional regulator with XRE-family HTH domain
MARSEPSGLDPDIARVGRAVTARRLELGMDTQKELAERAGVALNTAAFLERGRTFPRQANARKLEIALEWPPGTLESLLDEQDDQTEHQAGSSADPVAVVVSRSAETSANPADAVAIARAVVAVATTAMEILLRHADSDPETATALQQLDTHLLALETAIFASVPHAGEAFTETMAAAADVHRQREALKAAAAKAN